MFPEISKLIRIILIITVSSVPCERGFSSANCIKTRLRNHLLVENLDVLLRIIEGPPNEEFEFSKALEIYKSTRQHRIFRTHETFNYPLPTHSVWEGYCSRCVS